MEKRSLAMQYMFQALELASRVVGTTKPNPAVGALLVKNNKVIGYGATQPAGQDHAEVVALKMAGDEAEGATLYVTLEPCNHYGKTPPCSLALVQAKIKKVFIALLDPNPLVAGSGVETLKKAGVEVEVGLCEKEAFLLNEHFFHFITTGEPFVSIKLAMTLDGKIADSHGSSKWITSPLARKEVHRLRALHSAIGVGKGTLIADDPQLTVREVEGDDPIRVIFTSDITVLEGTFFQKNATKQRSIVALLSSTYQESYTTPEGVEVWSLGKNTYEEALLVFLQRAGAEGIDSLFIEGGASLIRSFIAIQKVQRMYLFYAPKILGGGVDGLTCTSPFSMDNPLVLEEVEQRRFDNDMLVTGRVVWKGEA